MVGLNEIHPSIAQKLVDELQQQQLNVGIATDDSNSLKLLTSYWPACLADRSRLQEAREELTQLLDHHALASVPIVVLGNKIDIPTATSEDELRGWIKRMN